MRITARDVFERRGAEFDSLHYFPPKAHSGRLYFDRMPWRKRILPGAFSGVAHLADATGKETWTV
jgi:hypothetical protein